MVCQKNGASKPWQWRKVHLGIDADALQIRAIEVTGRRVGLSRGLQANFCRGTDGVDDARACHVAIAARHAFDVIPSRKDARLRLENRLGANAVNETLRSTRRLGRAL